VAQGCTRVHAVHRLSRRGPPGLISFPGSGPKSVKSTISDDFHTFPQTIASVASDFPIPPLKTPGFPIPPLKAPGFAPFGRPAHRNPIEWYNPGACVYVCVCACCQARRAGTVTGRLSWGEGPHGASGSGGVQLPCARGVCAGPSLWLLWQADRMCTVLSVVAVTVGCWSVVPLATPHPQKCISGVRMGKLGAAAG
jgi:hypothetical protein